MENPAFPILLALLVLIQLEISIGALKQSIPLAS
jgi:hypothetical protein